MQWSTLQRVVESKRVGHAFLLSGREGLGLNVLANRFANQTLCEAIAARPCGVCRGCLLFAAGTHPDFIRITPANEGKMVVIDQVRGISAYYALKSHYGQGKVVIIDPADAMNRAAANALLKVLEEPPDGALIILVSHRFSTLPMTIRSRCVRVACESVDAGIALEWLRGELPELDQAILRQLLGQCGGAPLLAKAVAAERGSSIEDELIEALEELREGRTHALHQAKNYTALPLAELQRILNSIVSKIVLAKFGCTTFYDEPGRGVDPPLQGLVDHLQLKDLYRFLDLVFESKLLCTRQSGLRDADLAESLWLGLGDLVNVENGGGVG